VKASCIISLGFAIAFATCANAQVIPEVKETSNGTFAVFSSEDCVSGVAVDLTHSANGVAHFLSEYGRAGSCSAEMASAEYFASEQIADLSEIYMYELGDWKDGDLESVESQEMWAMYIFAVRSVPNRMTASQYVVMKSQDPTLSITRSDGRTRTFHLFDPRDAKPFWEHGYDVPERDDFPPYIRDQAGRSADTMRGIVEEMIEYRRATLQRIADAAAAAAAATAATDAISCQQANARLGECVEEFDMFSSAINITCGGQLAGAFGSRAGKCKPLMGYWCDFTTGNMYESRGEGAQAICP
jgi:hypothetical protein